MIDLAARLSCEGHMKATDRRATRLNPPDEYPTSYSSNDPCKRQTICWLLSHAWRTHDYINPIPQHKWKLFWTPQMRGMHLKSEYHYGKTEIVSRHISHTIHTFHRSQNSLCKIFCDFSSTQLTCHISHLLGHKDKSNASRTIIPAADTIKKRKLMQ